MNYFRKTCSRLIDALLPQRCALCQASTGTPAPVCGRCTQRLPNLPAQHCPRCGDFSAAAALCGRCLSDPPHFDRVCSPFLYAEPADRLIQALKYGHHLRLAPWFGGRILQSLAADDDLAESIDALVPVPLHPARMKTRGFNQSHEIGRKLASGLGKPLLAGAVARIRDTAPQASLPRQERVRNITGAFECALDLNQQTILVVDDVLTTGSSANELARVLKLHGARQVIVATAARAHHHPA